MYIRKTPNGYLLSVYVHPGAGRDEICGVYNDSMKIRISAAPVKNRANLAIQKFLSRKLGLSPSNIRIVRGKQSRNKTILLESYNRSIINTINSWE